MANKTLQEPTRVISTPHPGQGEGNSACSAIVETSNTNELLTIIQNTPIIRCDEPTVIFNMISLAELNLITMSILLMLNLICIIKNVRKR